MTTTTISTTKWWWSKKTKKAPKEKSIASSINGADEDASMFSLYSNDQSLYCPSSTYQVSSSIRGHHTKSEYSGNYSDVESNASILSKPWISRNIIENRSIRDSIQNMELGFNDNDNDDDNNSRNDVSSVLSVEDKYAYSIPMRSSSTDNLDNSIPPLMRPKRRASLVDYIVNKPLHGKLRVRTVPTSAMLDI